MPNSGSSRPAFFAVAGAAKCGTTSFSYALSQHPRICLSSPKEPFFFEAEYEKGRSFYLDTYYSHCQSFELIGEARHRNLYLRYVPVRIREFAPEARIFVLLRDPVARAWSHWWFWYSRGHESRPFREAIRRNLEEIDSRGPIGEIVTPEQWKKALDPATGKSEYLTYVDTGYYARQLKRYFLQFGRASVKVVLLEELQRDFKRVLNQCHSFLGLEERGGSVRMGRKNESYNSVVICRLVEELSSLGDLGWLPQRLRHRVSKFLRNVGREPAPANDIVELLRDHYRQHNDELRALLGVSLEGWVG